MTGEPGQSPESNSQYDERIEASYADFAEVEECQSGPQALVVSVRNDKPAQHEEEIDGQIGMCRCPRYLEIFSDVHCGDQQRRHTPASRSGIRSDEDSTKTLSSPTLIFCSIKYYYLLYCRHRLTAYSMIKCSLCQVIDACCLRRSDIDPGRHCLNRGSNRTPLVFPDLSRWLPRRPGARPARAKLTT